MFIQAVTQMSQDNLVGGFVSLVARSLNHKFLFRHFIFCNILQKLVS